MKQIEIRLDPSLVESLLEAIHPVLCQLETELATPAEVPEDDELMENFWKGDLLNAQRAELEVIRNLFDDEFLLSGRALIGENEMDAVIRGCAAIRLKLRETMLKAVSDSQLEEGDMEDVEWTDELQIGYAAYALFASLQELVISQLSFGGPESEGSGEEPYGWDGQEDWEDER